MTQGMTEPDGTGATTPEEQREVLGILQGLLRTIGSANDAEDHGYDDDAEQMRTDSCASIRALMEKYPFLRESLPNLRWELNTQHILGFGWAELCRETDAHLQQLGPPPSRTAGVD
jgi:hypothetical protein